MGGWPAALRRAARRKIAAVNAARADGALAPVAEYATAADDAADTGSEEAQEKAYSRARLLALEVAREQMRSTPAQSPGIGDPAATTAEFFRGGEVSLSSSHSGSHSGSYGGSHGSSHSSSRGSSFRDHVPVWADTESGGG
jgi:hypothetical protein